MSDKNGFKVILTASPKGEVWDHNVVFHAENEDGNALGDVVDLLVTGIVAFTNACDGNAANVFRRVNARLKDDLKSDSIVNETGVLH